MTPVLALDLHLRTLRSLIEDLSEDAYQAAPSRRSGSIGGHVRHCLDHVRALLTTSGDGLTYDSRTRGTDVEKDPLLAAIEIDRLCVDLTRLLAVPLDRQVDLWVLAQREGPLTRVTTTLGREIAFVIQHTIHHCAIIGILLEQLGQTVPRTFGYAPATPLAS
jgi:uncharacterized damage-inducible protein DinB